MTFVDTHAHLTDEAFFGREEEVINSFKEAGVGLVVSVGYDVASSEKSAFIAQNHVGLCFTAGLHPTDGEAATNENLARVESLLRHKNCVAVGEIGLDYRYGADRDIQRQKFIAQLEMARDYNMPVSIHARDCTEDMLGIVRAWGKALPSVILHCYSMGAECAKEFLKYNCYFAFGGAATFKNNRQIYENAKVIPQSRLLTETDCPYMAPVPHRGEINEPKYIPLILDKLAEVYAVDPALLKDIIYKNTLAALPRAAAAGEL